MKAAPRADLLQGTLDMLVLKALQLAPMHGWGITERVRQWSEEVLQINQGSLYPALYRLEQRGFIDAEWGTSEVGRKAKFYRITPLGRKRLAASTEEWARFVRAVSRVLQPT